MKIMFKDIAVAEFNHMSLTGVKVYKPEILKNTYLSTLRDSDGVEGSEFEETNKEFLRSWLCYRVMPFKRVHANEIMISSRLRMSAAVRESELVAIETRALSLNDCFWLKYSDEGNDVMWADVCIRNSTPEPQSVDVSLLGRVVHNMKRKSFYADLSTSGLSPKAWVKEGGDWFLLKGKYGNDKSILYEQAASTILDSFNVNHVKYILTEYNGIPCTKCKCMSSDKYSVISARVIFDLHNENWLSLYKSFLSNYAEDYAKMMVSDYLLLNAGRKMESWGFMVDNDTMQFVSMHPLINFNSAFKPEFGCDEFNELHLYSTVSKFIEQANLEMISPLNLDVFSFEPELAKPFLERLSKVGIEYEVRDNIVYPKR